MSAREQKTEIDEKIEKAYENGWDDGYDDGMDRAQYLLQCIGYLDAVQCLIDER